MRSRLAKRACLTRFLSPKDEQRLLGHVGQFASPLARRDHAWMRLLRHTGLRIGSLAKLTVGQARDGIESGLLSLRDDQVKGSNGYDVPLSAAAKQALRDLLAVRRAMGGEPLAASPLVLSERKGALSIRAFQQRMEYWCAGAVLAAHATPHWWRHTVAMRIMQRSDSKDPRGAVAQLLGHTSLRSSEIYTVPTREDVVRALEVSA